ncbi:ATP-dependent Clp protease adapter protein ClpS [Limnobacter litoralis]|uniref:ATP-dependent Clp protease adapter protein ClpS n=2 Tax=Burkholderiaceae TaxID=119060 RepID=A0ABQ5YT51_9BURK|nr:ATP-dependent Clp protease adapter protein ClpS [Limnobacter litoralis]
MPANRRCIDIGSDYNKVMSSQNSPTTVLEPKQDLAKAPPMYQVVLLNDDYTPMEFVVLVLQKFFGKGREQATQIMLKVHREGKGVCGVYPKDIASTKVELVCSFAMQHQHPLQCVMEET